jgi:hypothetical protein
MKKIAFFAIVFAAAAVLWAACSGSTPESKAAPSAPAVPSAPAQPPASASAPAVLPSPNPAQPQPAQSAVGSGAQSGEAAKPAATTADPLLEKLIGTSWQLGDFLVTFQDSGNVVIKGKPVEQIAPSGLPGKYSLNNGIIEISAMGQSKSGTWDGEKLVVDGMVGKKQ